MSSSDHGEWETKNIGAGLILAGFVLTWFWKGAGILSIVGVGLLLLGAIQDHKEDQARDEERRAWLKRHAEETRDRGY